MSFGEISPSYLKLFLCINYYGIFKLVIYLFELSLWIEIVKLYETFILSKTNPLLFVNIIENYKIYIV